jgi:transposase InsO family protein
VKPETVVHWSRQRFRTYWARKSRRRSGRPAIDPDIRALIRKLSRANPLWGTPRIDSELRKLGINVSPTTVAKYRVWQRHPPSPTWRSFLRNHARDLVAADFFTVPTATFQVLFVCVILANHRRRIVHLNVTANPTAAWTAQQVVEAFPEDTAPRYLLRDRDRIYGPAFRRRVDGLGISEVLTAARSPWQNPYAERVIGSIRRECLDHVIVVNEQHLRPGPSDVTSGITIAPGATSPSPGTRRLAAPSKGRSGAKSSPSRRSADSIIATNGRRHDR